MDFATFSLTTKSRVRVSDMVVRILLAVYWIQLDCVVPGFPFEDPPQIATDIDISIELSQSFAINTMDIH